MVAAESFVGKTYSLYGAGSDSDGFYEQLRAVTDACLVRCRNPGELLSTVHRISRNKSALRRIAREQINCTIESFLIHALREQFSSLTTAVAGHLESLSLAQRWDRTLAASEEQYHLYMLEIELTNRLNSRAFRECAMKLAFLPHCLRDLAADCQSTRRGEDYVCKGCSQRCGINAVSKLLRRHGIVPYIWMTANLRSLFRRLKKEGKHPGILGIACIPELISGMRMCSRAGVPVIGLPLDANRCARWWGEFHYNTVNLRHLERLLGEETRRSSVGQRRQPKSRSPAGSSSSIPPGSSNTSG